MSRLVFLHDFSAYRLKAFGDDHGDVHYVTDECIDGMSAVTLERTFDMAGTGVVHVKTGTSVRIPVGPVVTFAKPSDADVSSPPLPAFASLEIPINAYGVTREGPCLYAGFHRYYDRSIWVVRD